MSRNPSQLFLLADHIKLSLLERQRAQSLNLPQNAQDGQISRSLDTLQQGIQSLSLEVGDGEDDQLESLKAQYADLNSQFRGTSDNPQTSDTITSPNDPSLSSDFVAAQTRPKTKQSKSVRFRDSDAEDPQNTANRNALFPSSYKDDPEEQGAPDQSHLDNQQIHEYHSQVLRDQDDQLDRLGASIGRQRELSIQIGDELDGQALLLDEVDERVDRNQGQLDRAKGRLDRFARKARENWSMTTIVVLIVVLLLLIIITKS